MRKLGYQINLEHFKSVKKEIVPTLFTEHQFHLIEKKFSNKKLTHSENNEFSRTISKKMKAINKILEKETDNVFVYGKENIRTERLRLAVEYLKQFTRKFKNKHVFISGSFLYKKRYNDIDIFVISKYEKEDYQERKFHINYLTEDVYHSLFFASIKKNSVSNRKMEMGKMIDKIKEKINLNTFISLYQELFNDLDKKFQGVKFTLREFLLQAAYISKSPLPDSLELREQVDSILKKKKPTELIKKIFVQAVTMGTSPQKAIPSMKEIINSYKEIMREYKQHKNYYLNLIQAFKEVIAVES